MALHKNGNGNVKIGKLEASVSALAKAVDLLREEQIQRSLTLRQESDHRHEDLQLSIQTLFRKTESFNKELFDIRNIVSVISSKYEENIKASERLEQQKMRLTDKQEEKNLWMTNWGLKIFLALVILVVGSFLGPTIRTALKTLIGE